MFRFSLDAKDAAKFSEAKMGKFGISPDIEFADANFSRFQQQYPNFDPNNSASPGYAQYREFEYEEYFRVDQEADLKQAVAFVQEHFFFPPERVWIGDKVYSFGVDY